MKVLVVTSDVPFVHGGHRVFAQALDAALRGAGHESEIVTTPTNRFGRQLHAYLANRLTDVALTGDGERVDAVVSLRYPAFMVRHGRHLLWLTHLLREYYDLWPVHLARMHWTRRPRERARRALIRALDRRALRSLQRRFVISRTVQARLREHLGLSSEVLYPPPRERPYRTDGYGDFILAPSRLHPLKRQELLLRAMALRPDGARAVIVGAGPDRPRLEKAAADLGVAARVAFTGYVGEEDLVDLYARCRAVYFAPQDEDLGFVTLEAFRSKKPVVTCRDSGGPTELVADGESGAVVEPAPEAVAAALARLEDDTSGCRRMGEAGHEATRSLTWPAAVETLLS